ncbi:MAG: flagellin [Pseudomonadota bacterium]
MRNLESELATAAEEIASGKKDNIAKAIGSQLVNLQTIRNQLSENQAYIQSVNVFNQRIDLIDASLADIEEAVNSLVGVAAINAASPLDSASTVQLIATNVVDRLTTALNVEVGGRYLFGGAEVSGPPVQDRLVGNGGGISPNDVVGEVITDTAAFPSVDGLGDLTIPGSLAESTALLERFDDVFQGANSIAGPPIEDYSFENTFFNGEIGGTLIDIRLPNNSVQREENDLLIQGLRDIMQAAYILSAVDLEEITDDDAYVQLMTGDDIAREGALDLLASGLADIQRVRANVGLRFQQVRASEEATLAQNALFNNQIVDLENADPFETQTRFLNIEKQLEASYAASSRVLSLSLVNFIR